MDAKRPAPQDPRPGELLRDRLLLYIRALRIPPREGLELAARTLDALSASGMRDVPFPEPSDMETAMATLRTLCAERGLLPDADAVPCPVPPYNRGSMPPARISMTRRGGSLKALAGRLRKRPKEGRAR